MQELNKGVYIVGIISLCFTGISALTALACLIAVLTRWTYGKALFLWAQLLSYAPLSLHHRHIAAILHLCGHTCVQSPCGADVISSHLNAMELKAC